MLVAKNVKTGELKRIAIPSVKTMERWVDAAVVPAADGCKVEPDGVCEHGWPSKLMVAGYI